MNASASPAVRPGYISVDEIQRDLDVFLRYYNLERSHQGYRLQGRTPARALRDALGREELPSLDFTSPTPNTEINDEPALTQ